MSIYCRATIQFFLSRVAEGGARNVEDVRTEGMHAALVKIRPRAVMVTGYSPRFHRAAMFHGWRSGAPILFRGEATDRTRGSLLRNAPLHWLYGQCARVLYIGQSARRHYLLNGVPEDKLIFSPYFVNTEPFQGGSGSAVRERFGIAPERPVILFSGELTETKRLDLLLQAVKNLPVTVLFLGDGPLRAQLEAMKADAHFAGFQNQTQLSAFYMAADMLCLPSAWDTWGLVVNEALYHGVPCVVSDHVGCAPRI